jgi:hypothetical protein
MPIHVSYLAEEVDKVAPGIRIIVPMDGTPQAQRGSLCLLVDLQGAPDAELLAERVLSAMQRTYYSARGTQSQVIVETVRKAQAMIAAETQKLTRPWSAGVVCVGMMADRLALTGMGSAFAFLTAEDGSVGVFPPDRLAKRTVTPTEMLELWPLHRQKTGATTAMIAGSNLWLDLVPVRTLAATAAYVDAGSCIDAADGLREQAGRGDVPGVIMVISPDEPPSSPPKTPPTPLSDAPPPTSAPTPSTPGGGLPTALNASPPLISAPDATETEPGAPGSVSVAARMPPSFSPATATSTGSVLAGNRNVGAPPPSTTAFERTPPITPEAAAPGDSWSSPSTRFVAGARIGMQRTREFLESMLPERKEVAPAVAMAEAVTSGGAGFSAAPSPPPKVQPAAAPFTPPAPATGSRARIIIASAVILLLLVPAIVATLFWRQASESGAEADTLLSLAEVRYEAAMQALDQEDTATARALLTESMNFLRRAEEIVGRTPRSAALQGLIDRDRRAVENITPLYGLTLPLISFPAEMTPRQVMVIGQDIYLLDTGRNEIVFHRLAADGESLASSEGQVVLRTGDVVGGVAVGRLVDLAWQPPVPGYDDKSSLLVLDENNRVFRYNQQVDGASVVNFSGGPAWGRATQIETYRGRLYVADEGNNQIYRYNIGRYDEATPWFQPTTQVNLANLSAMRIDGDIWLLYQDGKVVRYRSGEQLPYSLDSSVALPAQAVDLWVGQDGDDALYLVDPPLERILVFNKESGAYIEQFQAAEGAALRDLRGLFIDQVHSIQYILTGDNLFQERLPR